MWWKTANRFEDKIRPPVISYVFRIGLRNEKRPSGTYVHFQVHHIIEKGEKSRYLETVAQNRRNRACPAIVIQPLIVRHRPEKEFSWRVGHTAPRTGWKWHRTVFCRYNHTAIDARADDHDIVALRTPALVGISFLFSELKLFKKISRTFYLSITI